MAYDEELGFKKIAAADWLQADIPEYRFKVTEQTWIETFLRPQLEATVPREIVRLYEVARGCIIYGWFFYPLLTLGQEQMSRVMEAAVREKCRLLGCEKENYHRNLDALCAAGLISSLERDAWFAGKTLRNLASHPETQMILDPGNAYSSLSTFTERINLLFSEKR